MGAGHGDHPRPRREHNPRSPRRNAFSCCNPTCLTRFGGPNEVKFAHVYGVNQGCAWCRRTLIASKPTVRVIRSSLEQIIFRNSHSGRLATGLPSGGCERGSPRTIVAAPPLPPVGTSRTGHDERPSPPCGSRRGFLQHRTTCLLGPRACASGATRAPSWCMCRSGSSGGRASRRS